MAVILQATEIRITILFTDKAFIRDVYIEGRGRGLQGRDLNRNRSRLMVSYDSISYNEHGV